MLVLSRKADETIEFPELGISIEVVRVKGNGVRLGIKAPDSVRILRGELLKVVNEFEKPAPTLDAAPTKPRQFEYQVA